MCKQQYVIFESSIPHPKAMQCHPHPDFLCRRYRLAGIYIIHKLRDKVREGISYRVRHQHVPFTFSIILVCQHKTELLEFIESFAYLAYHVCIGTSRDKHLEQLMFRLAKGTHDIHRSRKNSLSHQPGCLFLIQVRTYIQVQFLRNSSIRCFAMQL